MLCSAKRIYAQLPKNDALFDTVFVENFTGSTMNTNKWLRNYPWGQYYNANQVPAGQWCGGKYVAGFNFNPLDTHNRVVAGGTMKMIGKKESKKLERWTWPDCNSPGSTPPPCYGVCTIDGNDTICWAKDSIYFKYTNAMLWSKASFKYGYFEIKFRLPGYVQSVYNVFSPTFWLWSSTKRTPWSEIDIFEIDASTNQNFHNNVHVDTTGVDSLVGHWPIPTSQIPTVNLANWHTAAINWTPNTIDFYLDSTFIRQVKNDSLRFLLEMPMIIENVIPGTNFCVNAIDT